MRARLTTSEVLAIGRIEQWRAERTLVRNAKTTHLKSVGWQARNERAADARMVRILAFEQALSTLSTEDQTVLNLAYAEGQPHDLIAATLGCSVRKVSYTLPQALQRLTAELDKRDML